MSQSRRMSLLESVTSTTIGLLVGFGAQLVVFPLFGWHPPLGVNLAITVIFTAISIVRGYCVRRLFNAVRERA